MANIAIILVLFGQAVPPAAAQSSQATPQTDPQAVLGPLFERFKSPRWHERANAFRSLLVLGGDHDMAFVPRPLHLTLARFGREANQIHVALIALLARENAAVALPPNPPGHWGEDYMNYYGDLIEAVGVLGDPRAIDALAGAVATGGDATDPLASFGSAAVPALARRIRHGDVVTRNACLGALITMLEPIYRPMVTPAGFAEISKILIAEAHDENTQVRAAAVWGIGQTGDRAGCEQIVAAATDNSEVVRRAAAAASAQLHCGG
ncbi:MAG TPA: HEAT repeat domain-containing protein [Steroidobacteraceae bacterium]|nr:HEAT repeat domain-containing protein [Steroidobacteraceae bacterium]